MKLKSKTARKDKTISLGSLKGGDVFRFSHITATEAMAENAFYIVVTSPDKQGVLIANLSDGQCLLRDKEHRIIAHETVLNIEI